MIENAVSCPKENNAGNECYVSLSVQGALFVLQRSMVLSFDWMIAKMLMSDVPCSTYNGLIYVDSDPNSFRMILSILRGMITVESEFSRISTIELSLLKATARYLLCGKIVKEIELFQAEVQKVAHEKDELESRLTQIKNGPEFEIIKILKNCPISRLDCDCYRTRRPGNICNSKILIIGPAALSGEAGEQLDCENCDNQFQDRRQGYRPRERKFTVSSVNEMELLETFQELEKFNKW